MKKRTGLTVAIVLLFLLALLLAAGYIWLEFQEKDEEIIPEGSSVSVEELTQQLIEEHEEVSVDEDSGMIFVNNEIVVIASIDASSGDIKELAADYDARIIDAMEDIGVYLFQLEEAQTLNQLEKAVRKLKKEDIVDDAYVNPVSLIEEDASDEEPSAPEPVYPSDPWKKDEWDTDNPDGENWSVEAVRAPAAWGYLDQLQNVNIGLIDSMPSMTHEDLDVSDAYASFYDTGTGVWSTHSVTNNDISAQDHGTHVSGTMAALWNTKGLSGMTGDKANLYYSCAYNVTNNRTVGDYYTPYTYTRALSVLLDQDVCAINISQHTSRLIGFAASHGNTNAISYLTSQAELAEALLLRIIAGRQTQGRPDFVICVSAGNSNNLTYYPDDTSRYGYSASPSFLQVFTGGESGGSLAKYNNFLALIDDPEVLDRILVVGAVGMKNSIFTSGETRYHYSEFSNVGDRVDIAAPGEKVYSCTVNGYGTMSGTSMAAPHVTSAAAMVFAANPSLTGPEVKAIVCASTYGKFIYEGGSCGLLDLSVAISKGLQTVDTSVNRVVGTATSDALDLCFLVDTTGSMEDDIDNARENMVQILESLQAKTSEYRVAVVDYRDFPDRTGDYNDYAAQIQLDFSSDHNEIIAAINGLDLGYGGDDAETVYSGFAAALGLDWRKNCTKVMIVLGDAAPLDPEPYTDYTYDTIVEALYNADIAVDMEASDSRVLGDAEDSLIKIYSIGTEASSDAVDFFESIASDTGGAYTDVADASEVADAIQDSIEMIELEPVQTVTASFGEEFSGETVDFYLDDEYQFSAPLDSYGKVTLEDMPLEEYDWEIARLHRNGTIEIESEKKKAGIDVRSGDWTSIFYVLWERERLQTFLYIEGGLLVLIVLLMLLRKLLKAMDKRRLRQKAPLPRKGKSSPQRPSFCSNCGKPVSPTDAFCGHCGNSLN